MSNWDETNKARLSEVHPVLADRVNNFLSDMQTQGIPVLVTQGLRTWSQQASLYAQGRTRPGAVVTKAEPGYSSHNFGLAVDCAPGDASKAGQIDWNADHPVWKQMLSTGLKYRLNEGALFRTFPDDPHFYLAELNDTPTDPMRTLYRAGGLAAVWKFVDTKITR